tara:strand:+ start:3923 stop:4342 length:420 start_codon:yes stop_codon:yes gene_type:complete
MSYGKSTGIQTIYSFDQMTKYEGDDYFTLFFDVEFRDDSTNTSFHKFMLVEMRLERSIKHSEELLGFCGLNDKHSYESRSEVKYVVDEGYDMVIKCHSDFEQEFIRFPFSLELKGDMKEKIEAYIDSLVICESPEWGLE